MMITGHKTRDVFEWYRIVSVGAWKRLPGGSRSGEQHEQLQI